LDHAAGITDIVPAKGEMGGLGRDTMVEEGVEEEGVVEEGVEEEGVRVSG
jgi:hypothetical protein